MNEAHEVQSMTLALKAEVYCALEKWGNFYEDTPQWKRLMVEHSVMDELCEVICKDGYELFRRGKITDGILGKILRGNKCKN